MGQDEKDTKQKRDKSIKIRLTDAEFDTLNANKGRAELARWLRELGLESGAGRREIIHHQLPPEVVRNLAGIGANLNQISRILNTRMKTGSGAADVRLLEIMTQLVATERALDAVRELIRRDS